MRPVKLGLIQFVPHPWEVRRNLSQLQAILASAGGHELDLIVTPECIIDGYAAREAPSNRAWEGRDRWIDECALDPSGSEIITGLGDLARHEAAYLVAGYTERLGKGKAANTAGVFDRKGNLIATYHKTHLQGHDLQFEPGRGWTVVDTDFGRIGILICADRRWPEAMRCQRLAGAEIVVNPSYGMHNDLNLAMMRTRAYENGFYIAFSHPKQSLVTGPGGEVEVDVRSKDGSLVQCKIDLDRIDYSHIDSRRIDLYRDHLLTPRPGP